jgi:hypothetical protein
MVFIRVASVLIRGSLLLRLLDFLRIRSFDNGELPACMLRF